MENEEETNQENYQNIEGKNKETTNNNKLNHSYFERQRQLNLDKWDRNASAWGLTEGQKNKGIGSDKTIQSINEDDEKFTRLVKSISSIDRSLLSDDEAQGMYMALVESDPVFRLKDDFDGSKLFGKEAGNGRENLDRLLSIYSGINPNGLFSKEAQRWLERTEQEQTEIAKKGMPSAWEAAKSLILGEDDNEKRDRYERYLLKGESSVAYAGLMANLSIAGQKVVSDALKRGKLDEEMVSILPQEEKLIAAEAFSVMKPYSDAGNWLTQGLAGALETTKSTAAGTFRYVHNLSARLPGRISGDNTINDAFDDEERVRIAIQNSNSTKLDSDKLTFAGKIASGVLTSVPYAAAFAHPATASYAVASMVNDSREQLIADGVDADTAEWLSVPIGIVQGAIEKIQWEGVLGKGITQTQLRNFGIVAISRLLKDSAYKQAGRTAKKMGYEFAKTTLTETLEEVLQQSAQDVGLQVAEGEFNWSKLVESAVDTFEQSLPTTIGFGIIGASGIGPYIGRKLNPSKSSWRDLQEYRGAKITAWNIINLIEDAKSGKLELDGKSKEEQEKIKNDRLLRINEEFNKLRKDWFEEKDPDKRLAIIESLGGNKEQSAALNSSFETDEAYQIDNPFYRLMAQEVEYYGNSKQLIPSIENLGKMMGAIEEVKEEVDESGNPTGSKRVRIRIADGITVSLSYSEASIEDIMRLDQSGQLEVQAKGAYDSRFGPGAYERDKVERPEIFNAFVSTLRIGGFSGIRDIRLNIGGKEYGYDGFIRMNKSGYELYEIGHEIFHTVYLAAKGKGVLNEEDISKLKQLFGETDMKGYDFKEEEAADLFGKYLVDEFAENVPVDIFSKIGKFFNDILNIAFLRKNPYEFSAENLFEQIREGNIGAIRQMTGVPIDRTAERKGNANKGVDGGEPNEEQPAQPKENEEVKDPESTDNNESQPEQTEESKHGPTVQNFERRLTPRILSLYDEQADLMDESNAEFLKAYAEASPDIDELMTQDGKPTKELLDRVQAEIQEYRERVDSETRAYIGRNYKPKHNIVQSFFDGKLRSYSYSDSKGIKREIHLDIGSRKTGTRKIAAKHIVDFGTATTGGFTIQELDSYIDDIIANGVKQFDKKTGRRTFSWKSPSGVIFYVGTYQSGGKEYINTIHTNRSQNETRRLGTHFRSRTSSVNQAADRISKGSHDVNRKVVGNGTKVPTEIVTHRTPNENFQFQTRWAWVDLDDVVSSERKEFDQSLQPRDRTRKASQLQVMGAVKEGNFDPMLLTHSYLSDGGAPIVDGKNQVISGNGRTMMLRSLDEQGRFGKDYSEQVQAWAKEQGIVLPPGGMKKPVLVQRLLTDNASEIGRIATLSNRHSISGKGEPEVAEEDASILTPDLMRLYNTGKDDDLLAEENGDFIRAFVERAPDSDTLLSAEGLPTDLLVRRLKNALVSAIIGDHTHRRFLLKTLIENKTVYHLTDIYKGLVSSAGTLLKAGYNDKQSLDLTDPIRGALSLYVQYKVAKLTNKKVKLGDYTKASNLFDEKEVGFTEVQELAKLMDAGRFAPVIEEYVLLMRKAPPDSQDNLFGEAPETAMQMLARAERRVVGKDKAPVTIDPESEAAKKPLTDEKKDIATRLSLRAAFDAKQEERTRFSVKPPTDAEIEEARRQVREVEARYTNPDGSKKAGWMKAPNGKPTRLTERQWLQVRTENFKRWFGDWERIAEIEHAVDFVLNGEPVSKLTGSEFQQTGNHDLIERVSEFFRSIGGIVENGELGGVVVDRESVKSSIGHGIGRAKAAAFAAVPEVIRKGVLFDRQRNWKGRGTNTYVIAAPIRIGSENYVCEAIVEEKAGRKAERRFYLHEVNLQSAISDTIKTPTGGASIGNPSRPVRSILAKSAAEINRESVSKVVDENGEPLVVYRRDNSEFTVFDQGMTQQTDAGWLGKGFYFYGDENEAESATGYGKHLRAFYLNIRNPYFISAEEFNELVEKDDKDSSAEFTERLEDEGYDGVYWNGDMRQEWMTFYPNNIKLANGNAGTFDRWNPDVRYSISHLYTGSAADYEKPSLHYVGSGVGNQVYGWGIYASGSRKVADLYNEFMKMRSVDPNAVNANVYEQTFFTDRAPGDERHILSWNGEPSDAQLGWILSQAKQEGLVEKLQEYNQNRLLIGDYDYMLNGESIYRRFSDVLGSPKAASEFLARAGIDGIKYHDDALQYDGKKTIWNYVSFRDDNIRVDHKWTNGQQRFSLREREQSLDDAERLYAGFRAKNAGRVLGRDELVSPVEVDGMFRYSIGKKRAEQMVATLTKKRPDLDAPAMVDEVGKFDSTKEQKAAFFWLCNGSVRLPEDAPKVKQAVEVSEQAKVDPMGYRSPMELIDAHHEFTKKERPVDPDTVPQLSDKRVLKNGIVTYLVEDTKAGQQAMREVLNSHFGVDASPWCLLQGDGKGGLSSDACKYWKHYNAFPKRVAFKDGKLIAFGATDGSTFEWWDRKDNSHGNIPAVSRIPGDKLRRVGTAEFDPETGNQLEGFTDIHKGDKKNGPYEEWYDLERIEFRANYKDGKLDGLCENWYQNGQMEERSNWKDGLEDGLCEYWYKNGQLENRSNYKNGELDGLQETWYPNGQLKDRENYKNGKRDGLREIFYKDGSLASRRYYENGREVPMPPDVEREANTRFSVRRAERAVREADLIAIHNLNARELKGSLELGGFPMPSIAVTKASFGHGNFGDVSVLFGRGTVDPAKNPENRLYSHDADTPSFPYVVNKVDVKNAVEMGKALVKSLNGSVPDELFERLKNDYELTTANGMREALEPADFPARKLQYNKVLLALWAAEHGMKVESKYDLDSLRTLPGKPEGDALRKWIDGLFGEYLQGKYIAVDEEPYYEDGTRKPFSKTHKPVTLKRLVDSMKRRAETGADAWITPYYSAAKRFKSVDEAIANEGLLRREGDSEHAQKVSEFENEFKDLAAELADSTDGDYYGVGILEASSAIADAWLGIQALDYGKWERRKQVNAFRQLLSVYVFNPDAKLAEKILKLMERGSVLPTTYFEAKPRRAVKIGEAKAVVAPDSLDDGIRTALSEQGIPLYTYADKDEAARFDAVRRAATDTKVRFSVRVNPNLERDVADAANVDHTDGKRVQRRRAIVDFSNTPDILKHIGVPDAKIITEAFVIRKIVEDHNLSVQQIADIPNRYADPVCVFEEGQNYVILTDLQAQTKHSGMKPVMVYLEAYNQDGEKNFIASIYARESDKEAKYLNLARAGKLLYIDKKRATVIGLEEDTSYPLRPLADGGKVLTRDKYLREINTASMTDSDSEVNQNPSGGEENIRGSVKMQKQYATEDLVVAVIANERRKGKEYGVEKIKADLASLNLDPGKAEEISKRSEEVMEGIKKSLKREIHENTVNDRSYIQEATDKAQKSRIIGMSERIGMKAYQKGRYDEREAQKLANQKESIAAQILASAQGFGADAMESRYGFDIIDTVANAEDGRKKKKKEPYQEEEGTEDAVGVPLDEVNPEPAKVPEPEEVPAEKSEMMLGILERAKNRSDEIEARYQEDEEESDKVESSQSKEESKPEEGNSGKEDKAGGDVPAEPIPVIKRERLDFKRPSDFLAFVEEIVETELREKGQIREGESPWSSPVNRRELLNTARRWLQKLAYALCYSHRREIVLKDIEDLKSAKSIAGIECGIMNTYSMLQERMIKESRDKLVSKLEKDGNKIAKNGRLFSRNTEENERKVKAEVEYWWRNIKRYFRMNQSQIEEEKKRLDDIISKREAESVEDDAYDILNDRDWTRANDLKAALTQYGGLYYLRSAQIEEIARDILERLERSKFELEDKRIDDRLRANVIANRLRKAMSNPKALREQKIPEQGLWSRFTDSMIGIFHLRMLNLIRYSRGDERRDAERTIQSIDDSIAVASQGFYSYIANNRKAFGEALEKIYGSSEKGIRRLTEPLSERDRVALSKQGVGEINRAWLLQRYAELLQTDDYAVNIAVNKRDGAWRKRFDEVFSRCISTEDLLVMEWIRDWYRNNLTEVNDKVLVPITGIKQYSPGANYFPVKMKRNEREGYDAMAKSWTPYPKWLTPRVSNQLDFDERTNILTMWESRMRDSGKAIHYSQLGIGLGRIFLSTDMKKFIIENHGEIALRRLREHLIDIISGGRNNNIENSDDETAIADRLRAWQTYLTLSWNYKSAVKQMISTPTFALHRAIGFGDVFRAMTDIDIDSVRELIRSEGFAARYGDGFSEELQNALNTSRSKNPLVDAIRSLYEKGFSLIEFGDSVPCLWVGQGLYRHFQRQIRDEQGGTVTMSEDEIRKLAMARTWSAIEMTQQSKRTENLTAAQRGGALGRFMYQFVSSPVQQMSYEIEILKELYAQVREYGIGETDPELKKRFVRTVAINHILIPALLNLAAVIAGLPLGAVPDKDELIEGIILSTVLGQFGSLFIAGAVAEEAGKALLTGKKDIYSRSGLPVSGIADAFEAVGITLHDVLTLRTDELQGDLVDLIKASGSPGRDAVRAYRNWVEGANKKAINSWSD